jgi:ELWxxDGT repeat protein
MHLLYPSVRSFARAAICCLAIVGSLTPTPVAAAGPTLIRNVVHGPSGVDPGHLILLGTLGGSAFYGLDAADGLGQELWKTDATTHGTRRVKDINPGAQGSSPDDMVRLGSLGLFEATDASTGTELWKTNGLSAGTKLVRDIAPSGEDSLAFPLAVLNGRLLFSASDGTLPGDHGQELWTTDGSRSGTHMVKDNAPGPADGFAVKLAVIGHKALFVASDGGPTSLQLYVTDGTSKGTKRLKIINEEGPMIAYPGAGPQPVVINGIDYFGADDGSSAGHHGFELWRSDGTRAGTHIVKDIVPGTDGTDIGWMRRVGAKLLFSARDAHGTELWVSDGTAHGTRRVMDIAPGADSGDPYPLGVIGSTLYFAANDGSGGHGIELWRSDGTRSHTRMVKDIASGSASSSPYEAVVIGRTLLFPATDSHGTELWRSDGTKGGTRRVADLAPGHTGSDPTGLVRLGRTLVFFAADGVHGLEPWRYTP